jgi:hypothetical protein
MMRILMIVECAKMNKNGKWQMGMMCNCKKEALLRNMQLSEFIDNEELHIVP